MRVPHITSKWIYLLKYEFYLAVKAKKQIRSYALVEQVEFLRKFKDGLKGETELPLNTLGTDNFTSFKLFAGSGAGLAVHDVVLSGDFGIGSTSVKLSSLNNVKPVEKSMIYMKKI